MTILDLIRRRAAADPTRLAVAFETRRFSFADIEGGSNAAARVLRSCGAQRGDRVLLYANTSIEFVIAWLGALKLGATVVTSNPAYRDDDLGWILKDSEPSVILCDREGTKRVASHAPASTKAILEIERGEGEAPTTGPKRYPFYQALKKASVHPVDELVADSDLALLLYTSGTTGRAKGALLTHGNLSADVLGLHECFGWTRDDRLVHALPLFHVHGLCVALAGSLTIGGECHLLAKFDAKAVLDLLRSEKATLFMGVPTMYTRLLNEPSLERDTKSIRLFVSGSAPLAAATKERFAERTGQRILERYGMTETLITLAQRADGARPSGAVGLPVPGVEARIVDSDHHDVPPGTEGELLVRGATVGPGYWRNDAATESSRHDGWFQTGDLAVLDRTIGELRIVGRSRELILSGGLNIYPREVEEALESHPSVAEAAVFGMPDPDLGECATAVVVLRAGHSQNEAELLEHCRLHIASYKKPRSIRFVGSLPRNAMGKVQKDQLRRG